MRTSYRHGANFATGGSTVRRPTESWFLNGVSPFSLEIQTAQFDQFKVRSTYYFKQYGNKKDDNDDDDDEMKLRDSRLPRPEDFSKTLYVFDIGQNDLAAGFRNLGYEHLERLNETIPDVVEQLAAAVRVKWRAFWIHNTGPIGCLPITHRWVVDPVDGYLDEVGCVKDQNRMASEFNRQLEDKVLLLRDELAGAALTYVDVYLAKYELISGAKEQEGFGDPMKMCCGVEWEDKHVSCGQTATFNGTKVYAGSCKDPSSFISWDGTHYTEAANRWLADRIVNGSFSDQNTPIWHSCRRS
ncbi:hypothetical protein SAY86_010080 [Trapa natans]|uniref:GDSL esterase/lipase n=1 Tax=Trapa natans TaxID=22666 RepID=A0AAN7QTI7_TRANT|nr:hypothetical protein SAY86_010080 [Trapa natans]